jgi:hypothetical protein
MLQMIKQELESAIQHDGMVNQSQDTSHTFIARFWLEPREIKDAKPIWRGVVEHVASGQRRYLEDLDEVKAFIAVHLQDTEIWPHVG